MNYLEDQLRIAAYYDHLVGKFGDAPQAVDAGSQEALDKRYRVLTEVADLNCKKILEVGCGFGGLGMYLSQRYPESSYTGIDISQGMIDKGRTLFPDLRLEQRNVFELHGEMSYDVVLAQGIFYLLGKCADKKAQQILDKMLSLAREAVACCAISTWTERKFVDEYCVDPSQLLAWGRQLTRKLVLRHDYHRGDVCVYLYRE